MKDRNAPIRDKSGFFKIGIIALAAAIIVMAVMLFMPGDTEPVRPAEESVSAETESTGGNKDKWAEGVVTYNGKNYKYNTSVKTYLFMGIDREGPVTKVGPDENGGQADVLFLLVVDGKSESMKVIAINRNTMAQIDLYDDEGKHLGTGMGQICLQHAYGDGMGQSCRRTVTAVSRLFEGIPISGYIAMNLDGIRPMNHSVGGVTVTIEEDYTTGDGAYTFKAGETRKLTDDEAYVFIRSRDTGAFASADARLRRETLYMNAFLTQFRDAMRKSVGKAASLFKAVESYTVASIDAVSLAEKIYDYAYTDEDMLTPEGETVMDAEGVFEEFHPDPEAMKALIFDVFYVEAE